MTTAARLAKTDGTIEAVSISTRIGGTELLILEIERSPEPVEYDQQDIVQLSEEEIKTRDEIKRRTQEYAFKGKTYVEITSEEYSKNKNFWMVTMQFIIDQDVTNLKAGFIRLRKPDITVKKCLSENKILVLAINRSPQPGRIDEDDLYQLSKEEVELKGVIDQYKRQVKIGGGTQIILPLSEFQLNSTFFERVMNFHLKLDRDSTVARSIGPNVTLFSPQNVRRKARRRFEEGGVEALKKDLALMKKELNPTGIDGALYNFFGFLTRIYGTRDQKALKWAIQVYEEEIARHELMNSRRI